MSISTTTRTTSSSTFSSVLLSKLAVSPSTFRKMLNSTRSSSEVAEAAQVSTRTVQRYRKVLGATR